MSYSAPPPPPGPPGGFPPPGAGGYPPYQYQPPQDHPKATTALILGILGLVLCQVLAPFAWVVGSRTVREIDASQGTLGGRGNANAGKILGIIGTVFLTLAVLLLVGLFVLGGLLASSFEETCSTFTRDGGDVTVQC